MILQWSIHVMNSLFELEAYLGRYQLSMMVLFCESN